MRNWRMKEAGTGIDAMTLLSIKYRSAMLYTARIAGNINGWLTTGWRPALLWFGIFTTVVAAADYLAGKPAWAGWKNLATGIFHLLPAIWWKILILFLATVVLWLAWQARKRVIVEAFTDNANGGVAVKGLSTLLMVNIAKMRDLYSHVDEQRAVPTVFEVNSPFDTMIKVEDVSEFLQGAVSAEYKVGTGTIFDLPVGILMALTGRIMKGPRIIGSIYRDGGHLIMTAIYVSGKRARVWRVDAPEPLDQPGGGARTLDDMILELSYRIFTDLALNGTVRWVATYYFCEGLREYRNCLRTPVDRNLKLKRAEQRFISALSDDEKMYHAYHNLGVVYTELRQDEAAESAFLKAITYNKGDPASYYGLAEKRFRDRQFDEAIGLCNYIVNTRLPATKAYDRAKAYDLKGIAERLRDIDDTGGLDRAIESHRKAVKYAWDALCLAAFRRNDASRVKTLASYCLWDLAVAIEYRADKDEAFRRARRYREAEALLYQALSLSPSDDKLYGQLGEIYEKLGRCDRAADAYASAVQINPERMDYRASLAVSLAGAGDRARAYDACTHVLDHALEIPADDCTAPDIIVKTGKVAEKLGGKSLSERAARMGGAAKLAEACPGKDVSAIPCLEEKLGKFGTDALWWEYVTAALALGRMYLNSGKPDKAVQMAMLAAVKYETLEGPKEESLQAAIGAGRLFSDLGLHARAEGLYRKAIECLGRTSPQEIRKLGLEWQLARSLRKQNKFSEALRHAEKALLEDPLSPENLFELGKIHFELEEYDTARKNCEQALIWDPDNPDIFKKIGDCYRHLANRPADASGRYPALGNAVDCFEKALKLYEEDDVEEIDATLYWLGYLYFLLGENTKSISKFLLVLSRGFDPLNTRLRLGEIYLSNGSYYESEMQLAELLHDAGELEQNGFPLDRFIDARSGEELYLSEATGWANYFLALSRANQGIKLTEALDSADTSLKYAESIPDEEIKNHLRTSCKGVKGWIYFKQHQVDEAISEMTDALSIQEDIDILLHLARVYEHKASMSEWACESEASQRYLSRARSCCLRAKIIDKYSERTKDIDDMLSRLRYDLENSSQSTTKAA